jgi:hypothetical protein
MRPSVEPIHWAPSETAKHYGGEKKEIYMSAGCAVTQDLGNATFGTIEISALWLNWCMMLDIKNFDTWVVQRGP